jgi:hypothetical protein
MAGKPGAWKKRKKAEKKKKKKSSSGIKSTSTSLRSSSSSSLDHLFIIEPSYYYAQLYYIEPRIYSSDYIIATMMRVSVNYQPPLLFRAITVSPYLCGRRKTLFFFLEGVLLLYLNT